MRTVCNCIYVAITLAFTAGGLCQQVKVQAVTAPLADRKSEPVVSDVTVSKAAVTDVHLRPLFTTTIRLPDAVSSVAVGAPTLFEAEHADQEPRLVYIKPATKQPAESNLVITMRSGETISMRLISDGNSALNEPVDYIVDYKPQESFFIGSSDPITQKSQAQRTEEKHDPLDLALQGQARVSTPAWQSSTALDEKTSKISSPSIVGALGEIREINGRMLVAYSVRNQSNHWIEVLPPQIEVSSPGDKSEIKKKDRKHIVEAEQVPVNSFKVNGRRLAPGERVDGVVTFDRPGFKQSQERLLLELASANSVDKPLLLPVPFVAPGN
ncbi:hypothetical protein EDE15_4159 [Edaphobacter aggregans]|uniref:Uncharacterized protein n=1 Tax=Edaphobacter aggregans TaxID=570835 RepID=A0A428MNV1_9BACT|nr:hypothetical protein [Edaphobacter aggregans]RSL18569.1 hypothetical protein EDE15_4159 [Edaphobacter aggregans]